MADLAISGHTACQLWREKSVRIMNETGKVVNKIGEVIEDAHLEEPISAKRNLIREINNSSVYAYMKEVQDVVVKLQFTCKNMNEKLKIATRYRQVLERMLFDIRKDIQLNKETKRIRLNKPKNETLRDTVDELLDAELNQLKQCKRTVEMQLDKLRENIEKLDRVMTFVVNVMCERNAILDILPPTKASEAISSARVESAKKRVNVAELSDLTPVSCTEQFKQAIDDAEMTMKETMALKAEIQSFIERIQKFIHTSRNAVNEALVRRAGETLEMKQRIELSAIEARYNMNKNTRAIDHLYSSLQNTYGPVSSRDITAAEKVNRPLIYNYQKHCATQLPEGRQLIKCSNMLKDSLNKANEMGTKLESCLHYLERDKFNKMKALEADLSVYRLRKREFNTRMVLQSSKTCIGTSLERSLPKLERSKSLKALSFAHQ